MIKRLLLAAGILSALVGCGQVAGPATTATAKASAMVTGQEHLTPTTASSVVSTPDSRDAPARSLKMPPAAAGAVAAASVSAPSAAPAAAGAVLAASVSAPPAAPAAAAQPVRNRVTGPHGLNTLVGDYTDCTGLSEVPHDMAAIDTCHTSAVLFIGHNRGVFTPLLSYVVGDVIAWYDNLGKVHHLRIVAVRDVSSSVFPPVLGTYEFQTCLYPTGNSSMDRDLDAVEV